MHLGLAAWGFRETPLEKQLEITRRLGLDLLELSIAGHHNDFLQIDASAHKIAEVINLFKSSRVSLSCASTGNDFTQPEKADNFKQLEFVKKVIDIASEVGAEKLRIFAGFSPVAEVVGDRWKVMIDCLTQTADYAVIRGITPAIETHGGVTATEYGVKHFYSTSSHPETLLKMLKELPESVKINFDPANLYAVGIKNPDEIYIKLKGRIAYAHLKDFVPVNGSDSLRPAACGESDMDWKKLMVAMADFSEPCLIEYENIEDIEDGCQRSLQFLRGININKKQ
jgi:sugar phosphate isomerase/epimerase